jgi:hypothetical protein
MGCFIVYDTILHAILILTIALRQSGIHMMLLMGENRLRLTISLRSTNSLKRILKSQKHYRVSTGWEKH